MARLFNFLLVPFYTYFLVAADYGVVAAAFSYIAFFNVIYQYGMDQAYLRFAAEKPAEERDIFSAPFWAVAATSVVFSFLLILLRGPAAAISGMGAEYKNLIVYAAAVLSLDALCIVPFAKLRLQHRAWYFVGVRTASILVNVAANVILLSKCHAGPEGVFVAALLSSATSFVLLLPVIIKSLELRVPKNLLPAMLKFAWPFVPSGLAAMAVQVIDRPILLFLTDKTSVGIYQANYRMGIFMMLVVSMFDQAWRPFFLERMKQPDARDIFARVFTYFTFGGVWLAFALSFFIAPMIRASFFGYHLLHPSYWQGLGVIPIVLTGYLFYGFYINFMVAPVISKHTGMLVWITAAGAAVNVAGNLMLVPRFSIIGAAWATFASYFIMAAMLFMAGRKMYPIPYETKRLARILMASVITLELHEIASALLCDMQTGLLIAKACLLVIFPLLVISGDFLLPSEKEAAGHLYS